MEYNNLDVTIAEVAKKLFDLKEQEAQNPVNQAHEYYITKSGKCRKKPKPIYFYVIDPGDCYCPYELWLRMQIGA